MTSERLAVDKRRIHVVMGSPIGESSMVSLTCGCGWAAKVDADEARATATDHASEADRRWQETQDRVDRLRVKQAQFEARPEPNPRLW